MYQSLLILPVARVFNHTINTSLEWVDVEVSPEMPRTKSEAFSESDGPISQDECGSGKLMTAELCLEY